MSAIDRSPAIVFHCYGGTHCSVVAAAVRCGHVSPMHRPRQFSRLPWFDQVPPSAAGHPVLIGRDQQGHRVFALGRRCLGRWMLTQVPTILHKLALGTPVLLNAGDAATPLMKAGGLLSRGLRLVRPGRALLEVGTRQAWPGLCSLASSPVTAVCGPPPAKTLVVTSDRPGFCGPMPQAGSGVRVMAVDIGSRSPLAVTLLRSILGLSQGAEWLAVVSVDQVTKSGERHPDMLWDRWRCPVH